MNFETVERCGRIYVIINGVESAAFALYEDSAWRLYSPEPWEYTGDSLEDVLDTIICGLDTWYTSAQAAERLVGLGAYDKAPSRQTISKLAQAGAFPGAFLLRGKGAVGRGGQWRISERELVAFAERRVRE